ncbi:MAG: CHAT domain-containing protein [Methylococcaceae bacterium]
MSSLPETAIELKEIARYLKMKEDSLYLGKRATESRLKSLDLSSTRIVAFATHGLLPNDTKSFLDPAEAALVLTPPKVATNQDDGLLTASEIAQLKLDADWVILSACNTAAVEKKADGIGESESLAGIANAFFYAGARSLLVSHWNVESSATSQLMIGLFKQLANNPKIRRAEALQKSMLNLISDKENPHYAHPLFWAPFVVVGEGGAIVTNQAGE